MLRQMTTVRYLLLLGLAPVFWIGTAQAGQDETASAKQPTPYLVRTAAEGSPRTSKPDSSGAVTTPSTSAPRGAVSAAGVNPSVPGYRIGVDDELQIAVWKEPDLSAAVVVRPDGMITLPLLNDLSVVGQTPEELQALLTEKLKPFVNEPQVTVIVRTIRSRRIYLVGQVPRPGAYSLSDRKTILQLIAEAGGLSPFAKSSSIYVLRRENGHEIRIPFNYKRAIKGMPEKDEVLLMPGDMVVVP